jgi:hypothetical protein
MENKKVQETVKSKLLDFEKMIADSARASGIQPRTYLKNLVAKNEAFAKSPLVKVLMGEDELPFPDAREVKTKGLRKDPNNPAYIGPNTSPKVAYALKQYVAQNPAFWTGNSGKADKKDFEELMRLALTDMNVFYKKVDSMDSNPRDGVYQALQNKGLGIGTSEQEQTNEDETSAVMDILAKHPEEYKMLKDGNGLGDDLYAALFTHFSATGEMPYGTQKARDGDPYQWIEDELDDLGLLETVVEAFDDHKEDLAKELYYNGSFKEEIQSKFKTWEDYMASEEFEEDAARLMSKFESVAHVDETVIHEALDEAKKKKGKKKPAPTSPDKWSRAKAKARSKFDVYPSAYANAYAAKEYKKMGGGWRMATK